MEIERVKIIAVLLEQAIVVEALRTTGTIALSPEERTSVLNARAAKIELELRDAGFAILTPTPKAPVKSPTLAGAIAGYQEAKALLDDGKDPCAEGRRLPA